MAHEWDIESWVRTYVLSVDDNDAADDVGWHPNALQHIIDGLAWATERLKRSVAPHVLHWFVELAEYGALSIREEQHESEDEKQRFLLWVQAAIAELDDRIAECHQASVRRHYRIQRAAAQKAIDSLKGTPSTV
jgi:hypothetical protein